MIAKNIVEAYNKYITKYFNITEEVKNNFIQNKYTLESHKKALSVIKPYKLYDDISKYNGIIIMADITSKHALESRSDHSKHYGLINFPLSTNILVLHFEENSPYIIKYSKIVDQLFETGIDKKWERDFRFDYERKQKINQIDKYTYINEDETTVLTFCTVLFTGWTISILVFLGEWIYYKYANTKNLRVPAWHGHSTNLRSLKRLINLKK